MTGLWWIKSIWRSGDQYTLIVSTGDGMSGYVQKTCTDPRVRPTFEAYLLTRNGIGGGACLPIVIEEAGVDEIRRAYVPQDMDYPGKQDVLAALVLET